jgi:zinc protease
MKIPNSMTWFIRAMLVLIVLSGLPYNTAFAIPTIQHWQTDNGAQVYFVPAPNLPMLDVEVTFDAGSARDGEKAGLAMLTNGLLGEGAGGYSADQIAEHFDSLGAELDYDVDRDTATVSLRSLTEPQLLQSALEMLAVLLAKPDFDEISFERVRQQLLTSLNYQQQSPDDIAEQAFYRAVFGSHPYASPLKGTLETVTALTGDDVKNFHADYYVAKNAVVAIVGALDRTAAEELANTVVAQLPIGKAAAALPSVAELTEAQTIHIDHPSTQTHILIGQPGMKRGDSDYFTLYVGNYMLGGSGLVSRISHEVREKRGLAYSSYSYFFPLRKAGPFLIGLETGNEQTSLALQVVRQTLQDFVENGPSEADLKTAKQGITGRFPLRIMSNSKIIGYLSMIGFYRLPLSYLHDFNQNVEVVTSKMIKETFQRRLQLDKLITVTVGSHQE